MIERPDKSVHASSMVDLVLYGFAVNLTFRGVRMTGFGVGRGNRLPIVPAPISWRGLDVEVEGVQQMDGSLLAIKIEPRRIR